MGALSPLSDLTLEEEAAMSQAMDIQRLERENAELRKAVRLALSMATEVDEALETWCPVEGDREERYPALDKALQAFREAVKE